MPRGSKSAAGLLRGSHQSECVRITCSCLMITDLLQVVNMLDAGLLSRRFIHKLKCKMFQKPANKLKEVCSQAVDKLSSHCLLPVVGTTFEQAANNL